VCDDCKSDVLDPAVAVEQVKALRHLLRSSPHQVTWLMGEIDRIVWPEVWVRSDDGSKVAIIAGEPVKFSDDPDSAVIVANGQAARVAVIPIQRNAG